jgi:hypothetical protein
VAKYRRICAAVALAWGVALGSAYAQDDQARPAADDPSWNLCTQTAAKVEAQLGLPGHILSAISLAETGWAGPYHQIATWPWTVHDGTKGYHFATERQAVDFVRQVRTDGRRSIDVGCMQVNLLHHPRAFTSVDEGFDPAANIRYAGTFLKDLAASSSSWEEAIAKYHTQNPTIDEDYAPRVLAFWLRERGNEVADAAPRTIHLASGTAPAGLGPERVILASATTAVPALLTLPKPRSSGVTAAVAPAPAGAQLRRFDSAR